MNIQVFYDSGRVDEFDVDRFTLPQPFDGNNMLTNFEVRFDNLDTESLWLQAHFYDIRAEYRQDAPPDETPVARRMRGWRFLLVDKTEIRHVSKIVVNKEMVAWRVGEDLINGIKFRAQELACFNNDTASSINSKAVAVHDYLANADPLLAADEEELCQTFGYTRRAYEQACIAEACQPTKPEKPDQKPVAANVQQESEPPEAEESEEDEGGSWLENLPTTTDKHDERDDDEYNYDDYDECKGDDR